MSGKTRSDIDTEYPLPIVGALLPDSIDWDETGLLPADQAYLPLRIEVPPWSSYQPLPGAVVRLRVYLDNDNEIASKIWDEHVPSLPPADLLFDVDPGLLLPGNHEVFYRVTNTSDNTGESFKQPITVDLTAPILGANNGQLQFDTINVTEQYLKDHGDVLAGRIQSYSGGRPGDVVTWYWSESAFDFDDSDIVSSRILYRGDIGRPVVLPFTGNMIRDRGDGRRYAFYMLKDRAGNSAESRAIELQVSAQPIPRVLPAPTIKEAPGNILNPSNAINGATVVIPAAAVIRPGEKVFVQWAEPGGVGSHRAEVPAGQREYRVPADRVPQHFGKSIPVFYEVEESGVADPHVSVRRTLAVSTMSGFPTVQCDKVSGSQLKLSNVTDYANFTLDTWSFMAVGQYVNVTVAGLEDSTGRTLVINVLTDYRVPQAGTPINAGRISKADLMRFRTGMLIEVGAEVSFNEKQDYQRFPSLRPTLVA
jgi:hypothetical protein